MVKHVCAMLTFSFSLLSLATENTYPMLSVTGEISYPVLSDTSDTLEENLQSKVTTLIEKSISTLHEKFEQKKDAIVESCTTENALTTIKTAALSVDETLNELPTKKALLIVAGGLIWLKFPLARTIVGKPLSGLLEIVRSSVRSTYDPGFVARDAASAWDYKMLRLARWSSNTRAQSLQLFGQLKAKIQPAAPQKLSMSQKISLAKNKAKVSLLGRPAQFIEDTYPYSPGWPDEHFQREVVSAKEGLFSSLLKRKA